MPERIAIAGAGICGLVSALAFAKKGHDVIVFERDEALPSVDADQAFFDWERPGAAQFRHPHAFLGLMCNILEENYPELLKAFHEAGARTVSFREMLSPELRENYEPAAGDERIWILSCRRATMETVLRRHVAQHPNVEIINPCSVDGLLVDNADDPIRVKGLRVSMKGGDPRDEFADIVIDASGRTSRFPGWLKENGSIIREEKQNAEIVYYTRHYRLKEGQSEPARGNRSGAGDLGYLKYGVFPGDNGHFAIILCLPTGEDTLKKAVRDPDQFDRICRAIPGLLPWVEEDKSIATTEPFGIGDIVSVWRDFVIDGEAAALDFFAVGDAAMRTNPLYGRGCSTGILHAQMLAELIGEIADPRERASEFHARTRQRIRPIFDFSLREDRRGIERANAAMEGRLLEDAGSVRRWIELAVRDALSAATREQIHVVRGAMRSFNLLEQPGEFLKEWPVRWTLLRYLMRGRDRNARRRLQSGPDRDAMHEIVAQ